VRGRSLKTDLANMFVVCTLYSVTEEFKSNGSSLCFEMATGAVGVMERVSYQVRLLSIDTSVSES